MVGALSVVVDLILAISRAARGAGRLQLGLRLGGEEPKTSSSFDVGDETFKFWH